MALTLCALIWGGATLLTGLAGTLTAMLFARVLLGFGEGATFPTATRALCDWMPEGKRAFAQGITHSCARIGTALTPPVVAWLIVIGNWRLSFAVLGMVSIAWAVVLGILFSRQSLRSPRSHLRGIARAPALRLARRKEKIVGALAGAGAPHVSR